MRRSDFLPPVPPRFVVLRLAVPARAPVFVLVEPTPLAEPGAFGIGSPAPMSLRTGDDRISRVPGEPSCACAVLFDPGRTGCSRPLRCAGAAPALEPRRGLPAMLNISGLDHATSALAVYASPAWLPEEDARLACRCWPDSTARDWLPSGLRERFHDVSLHAVLLSQAFSAQGSSPLFRGRRRPSWSRRMVARSRRVSDLSRACASRIVTSSLPSSTSA